MSSTQRRRGNRMNGEAIAAWMAIGTVVIVVGTTTAAAHLARAIVGGPPPLPANPAALVIGLLKGTVDWPAHGTVTLAVLVALRLAALTAVLVARARRRRRRSRVDVAAGHMGRGTALAPITEQRARKTAAALGVTGAPGLPIAATVATGQTLYSSWEDVCVDVWGPRTGKTTSRAVPAILAAPGAVVATSNKRDLTDSTPPPAPPTARCGCSTPQDISGEPASWWWNPLSYVTDEVQAMKVAKVLVAAARDPGARTDAYFDKAGPSLISGLLLAAALDHRPITQVYLWLTRQPTNEEPARILRAHDYPLSASALEGIMSAPEKQKGGVYGTAAELMNFLISRSAMRWVTTDPRSEVRREFHPARFVRSTDTLYLLSKEGEASTGPLVTALTVAVCEAAENLAKTSPRGWLATPMVVVLDEAANVCRWHNLPDLYSHFGSRGICVLTFLQSWSQGIEVWGREGMRKLWSAANVKTYGGGVSEAEFLTEVSQLIGDYVLQTASTSTSQGNRSTSRSEQTERILDVSDLAALPKGRAVVFASSTPAVLCRTLPWWTGPHKLAVQASLTAHDPTVATRTAPDLPVIDPEDDVVPVAQLRRDNPWVTS